MKKIIILLTIFILVLPALPAKAEYVVWDKQKKVYRDYGNITNYKKALEEIVGKQQRIIFDYRATVWFQSNTITIQSNYIDILKENNNRLRGEIPWYEKLWDKSKFWVGFFAGLLIIKEAIK